MTKWKCRRTHLHFHRGIGAALE